MTSLETSTGAGGGWSFDNSYARLPKPLFARLPPVPVRAPSSYLFNRDLAHSLGLDADLLEGEEGVGIFSGNRLPEGADPIAQAYAGHQFGHFTMLGDGRAILLGEQISPGGSRFDIQLKGSGRTPFSRGGDGRAPLGPMLREYIVSEAMHALGISTTRSLAVVATGERVHREISLPGAILTRVAKSHIRVGTFEYLATTSAEHLRELVDYTLRRHFSEVGEPASPPCALLEAVVDRQASLIAEWMLVGFIHGVMNSDNTSLCGETIDYGPCAFMDEYDPSAVFSSIDRFGRYAFSNQPRIAQWNLARFAETMLPLIDEEEKKAVELAEASIRGFSEKLWAHWLSGMRGKLGMMTEEQEDESLIDDLLNLMHRNQADYTNTFRELAAEELPDEPFFRLSAFETWHERWRTRLARQPGTTLEARRLMRSRNPAVIPRNHKVEEALTAAVAKDDSTPLKMLLEALSRPYDDLRRDPSYRRPPASSERVHRTFCGT